MSRWRPERGRIQANKVRPSNPAAPVGRLRHSRRWWPSKDGGFGERLWPSEGAAEPRTLGGPNKEVPVRTFLRVTTACVFLIQGYAARGEDPVFAAQPASTSADSAEINCREVQRPMVAMLECPAFDLIVSTGQSLPLATLSKVLSAGGMATTESVLMISDTQHPALRIEKQRSDGGAQIGWATIVVVDGVERNVTCYLHPPHTEEKACAEGLSQLSRGQLRLKVN